MAPWMLLVSMLWVSGGVRQDPASVELPEKARDAITEKWQGWTPAPATAGCDDVRGAGPVALADFDNDNHADYALRIAGADGVRLIVAMYRPWGFELFDLGAVDPSSPAVITIEPRGSRFVPEGGIDDYFAASTIVMRPCTGGATAYLWTGATFRSVGVAISR